MRVKINYQKEKGGKQTNKKKNKNKKNKLQNTQTREG